MQDRQVRPLLASPIDPGECRGRPVPSPTNLGRRPDSVQPDRATADEGQRAGDRAAVNPSDEQTAGSVAKGQMGEGGKPRVISALGLGLTTKLVIERVEPVEQVRFVASGLERQFPGVPGECPRLSPDG